LDYDILKSGGSGMAEEQHLSYPLHECVFEGDVQKFARMMRTEDLSRKDKHGTVASRYQPKLIITYGLACYVTTEYLDSSLDLFVAGNTALHLAIMLGRKGRLVFGSEILFIIHQSIVSHDCLLLNNTILIILFTHLKYISDIVQLLLAHNAPVKVKNINGWTPLSEAISYGDRLTSKFI